MSIFKRRSAVLPRVVLYTKDNCSLCDEAHRMLDRMRVPFETAFEPAYDLRVPVIEVGGRVVTEGRVSERAVRAAVKRGL